MSSFSEIIQELGRCNWDEIKISNVKRLEKKEHINSLLTELESQEKPRIRYILEEDKPKVIEYEQNVAALLLEYRQFLNSITLKDLPSSNPEHSTPPVEGAFINRVAQDSADDLRYDFYATNYDVINDDQLGGGRRGIQSTSWECTDCGYIAEKNGNTDTIHESQIDNYKTVYYGKSSTC